MLGRSRIALVAQHLDHVSADRANSVGNDSRELAAVLSQRHDVALFALARHADQQDLPGVEMRFIAAPRADGLAQRVFNRTRPLHKVFNRGFPIPTSTGPLSKPFWGRRVAQDLAAWQPDIVLVQHNARRVPPIRRAVPHATIILLFHQSLFEQECSRSYLNAMAHADIIAAVSPFTAEAIAKRIDRPTEVIRNGVRPSFLQVTTRPALTGPRILFCAAVSPEKGAHILARAFEDVLNTCPDATLTFVGAIGTRTFANVFPFGASPEVERMRPYYDGAYRARILEPLSDRARARVTFTGHLTGDALHQAFADADLFVLPSLWDEAFGLPVVEAMAAGLPVIVSDSGAMPWLVDHGNAGLVVPKEDSRAIARAIEALWKDPEARARLGQAALARCGSHFTWEIAASDMEDLVQEQRGDPRPNSW